MTKQAYLDELNQMLGKTIIRTTDKGGDGNHLLVPVRLLYVGNGILVQTAFDAHPVTLDLSWADGNWREADEIEVRMFQSYFPEQIVIPHGADTEVDSAYMQ